MVQSQKNLILSRLSAADFGLLEPHLDPVQLPLRKVLESKDRRIIATYFPESGFASVVANGKQPIEVGLIGREGMTGLAIVLGSDRGINEVFIQAAGHGHSVKAKVIREAINSSVTLHRALIRYAHSFLNQTTRTAVANGRGKIDERLARWILMAADRIDDEELPLTQEFLAMMLGVRRPGVTVAMQELETKGVIRRSRGKIVIHDRKTLEKLSNGTYAKDDGL